ncbi:MAG: GNAT family N-acetyltransferase [Alphaproteobacteria bacterium]
MRPEPLYVIGPKGYHVSDDPARMDRAWVITELKKSYWAKDVDDVVLVRSIMNAKPFGLYAKDKSQVGFARLVTDEERFAWLSDVILDEDVRGQGLGYFFMRAVLNAPIAPRQGKILLSTDDAHGFYEKLGFVAVSEKLMELRR